MGEYYQKFFTSKEGQMGETPSVTMHATARGLAKFAAYLANKGSLNG